MALKRVILDTNVLIAASRARRTPTADIRFTVELVRFWLSGHIRAVTSNCLIDEYADVLARPDHEIEPSRREQLMMAARDPALTDTYDIGDGPFERISIDPKDDHILALVRRADPDFLCTSNVEDLLDLHIYRDTVIVDPAVLYAKTSHEVWIDQQVKALRDRGM